MDSSSTNESPTSADSEPRFHERPAREWKSLCSISQRLDFVKPIYEMEERSSSASSSKSKGGVAVAAAQSNIHDSAANLKVKKQTSSVTAIVTLLAVAVLLLGSAMFYYHSLTRAGLEVSPSPQSLAPANRLNLDRLFDPVQVKYIQSYEESAVGKYFYWDLLADEYFKLIKDQLMKIVWMEEEVIIHFFDAGFSRKESELLRKKIWKLRDRSGDISVELDFSQRTIWRYKNCVCIDPSNSTNKSHLLLSDN